jgi:hypothetical protein
VGARSHDPTSNRNVASVNGLTESYTTAVGSNRLANITSSPPRPSSHDAVANLLGNRRFTAAYDPRRRSYA